MITLLKGGSTKRGSSKGGTTKIKRGWSARSLTYQNLESCQSDETNKTKAEVVTSISVGTQLVFLGCNQGNNHGSNFITKKKICLVLPEKEISNHIN